MTLLEPRFSKLRASLKGCRRQPLLGGNNRFRSIPVDQGHEEHIEYGSSLLPGFRYRELSKFKDSLKRVGCDLCTESLLRTAAYLKVHAEAYNQKSFCLYVFKNCLTPTGQEYYDELQYNAARRMDALESKDFEAADKFDVEPLRKHKVPTRNMPNLNSFPFWDLNKESKMYLTEVDPPTESQIESFKGRCEMFLRRWAPDNLVVPSSKAEMKTGSAYYYDKCQRKRDSEKPEHGYHGPFLYTSFMTKPGSKREAWIPCKAYKSNSSWWHMFTAPILMMVPQVVCNDNRDMASLSVARRFRPCKSIDLKGCGLQYPREYVKTLMDVLCELYPDQEITDHRDVAERLFSDMCVEMDDKTFVYPKRGVGLGYYGNLMTLCTAIMLDGLYIVKMFSDDILIDEQDYDTAIDRLKGYSMVINEEKSGIEWKSCALFAGVLIFRDPSMVFFSEHQAALSALFCRRYHWERKAICPSLPNEVIPYIAYHYERIFGYEFFSGECLNSPENLGINTFAHPIKGWTKDYPLNRMTSPTSSLNDHAGALPYVVELPVADAREFHKKRKATWKRLRLDYNLHREMVDPVVEPHRSERIAQSDWAKSIPMWFEENQAIWEHVTTRKMVAGLSDSDCNNALKDCKYSRNPYLDYATGGCVIITPGYEQRPAYDEHLQVAELMKICKRAEDRIVSKTIPVRVVDIDDWTDNLTQQLPREVRVEAIYMPSHNVASTADIAEEQFHYAENTADGLDFDLDQLDLDPEQSRPCALVDEYNPDLLLEDWDDVDFL